MAPELTSPKEGIPRLSSTAAQYEEDAQFLLSGLGPFAIDTERAPGFRYDDRAFLVQIRRVGAGTVLVDPEADPASFTAAFAPVLNGQEWIIHAAPTDLPCLSWLGLKPGHLIDTELAARMLNIDHPNLANLIEIFCGYSLAKEHGASDWSQRPLSLEQLNYAALDVELLGELATDLLSELAEEGKSEWFMHECAYIAHTFAHCPIERSKPWTSLRGVGSLKDPRQLTAAQSLYEFRDEIAKDLDMAPSLVLPAASVVHAAKSLPSQLDELRRIRGFSSLSRPDLLECRSLLAKARTSPNLELALPRVKTLQAPNPRTWQEKYPQWWSACQEALDAAEDLAAELNMNISCLVRSRAVREAVWLALSAKQQGADVHEALVQGLQADGAREWQIALVVEAIAPCLESQSTG